MPKTKLDVGSNVIELARKPAELEAFIEWLALPESERDPKSQAAFGRKFDVTEQNLSMWKRDPRVITRVNAARRHSTDIAHLPNVIESLTVQATDPSHPRSVQAAKVLMAWWAQTIEEVPSTEMSQMSNAELRQMAADMYDVIDERTGS